MQTWFTDPKQGYQESPQESIEIQRPDEGTTVNRINNEAAQQDKILNMPLQRNRRRRQPPHRMNT